MTPADFSNFFAASSGAAAALVGLLFVSVSLSPEQTITADAPMEKRAMAGSTFTALLNALFVSLGALIPGGGLGGIVILISLGSLASAVGLSVLLLKGARGRVALIRTSTLIAAGLALYAFELFQGILLTRNPADVAALHALTVLILVCYGLGMLRAWELLGAQSFGIHALVSHSRSAGATEPAPERTSAPSASASRRS